MPLTNYQKTCYRWFGRIAENMASDKLKLDLEKAHINMRPGAYLSSVWINTILAAVVSFIVFLSLILFLSIELWLIFFLLFLPIVITVVAYFYFVSAPGVQAKRRGKKIDLHLPYALNFISAMSSAGITPTEIFKILSKQCIYGEIREEALWIYRDVSLLGRDIISAIKANIQRTPSEKFKEFLQGTIVTIQSGGELKPYFMTKADQYTRENRADQKQLIESLGMMAGAYVTAAVAGVLVVIIILPSLIIISNSGSEQLNGLYVFVFLVVPIIHLGFSYFLSSMCERV